MEYIELNNGIKIPALGYGLFMVDPYFILISLVMQNRQ